MITSIEMERFRGIKSGKLEGLTPLVVLVGPNGCGKSAVLEAIHIGATPEPGHAAGQAVVRHRGAEWPRWLVWRTGIDGAAHLSVQIASASGGNDYTNVAIEVDSGPSTPQPALRLHASRPLEVLDLAVSFGEGNYHVESRSTAASKPRPTRLSRGAPAGFIDPSTEPTDGYAALLQAVQVAARDDDVRGLLHEVVPSLVDIVMSAEDGRAVVHLKYEGRSVPVQYAGEGTCALVRLCCELAVAKSGTSLVEEPEAHLHPGAIWQAAKAIVGAVRSGTQVILSTHSLEMIDALVAACSEPEDLGRLSLYRLKLADGELFHSRMAGDRVAVARDQIGDDLR